MGSVCVEATNSAWRTTMASAYVSQSLQPVARVAAAALSEISDNGWQVRQVGVQCYPDLMPEGPSPITRP